MIQLIRFLKILIAISFLGVAYLFYAENDLFGISPIMYLVVLAVIGALVLLVDKNYRRRVKKVRGKRNHERSD